MSCFIQSTVQNPKLFNLQSNKPEKSANPHIGGVGSRESLAFLLTKKSIIDYHNQRLFFLLIDSS